MLRCEEEAGISYAELGINITRWRGERNHKTWCPECGGTRKNKSDKSLSVEVEEGQWRCHNTGCDWHGGLGAEGRERMRDSLIPGGGENATTGASGSGGRSSVSDHPVSTPQPSAPSAPRMPPIELHDWAIDWFKERAIPEKAVRALGITSQERGEDRVIHYPYKVDGKLVNVKHRTLPKKFTQESGTLRSLFNVDNCQDADTIVIVEGECLTPDTEVLTEDGWVRLDQYQLSGKPVAQYREDGSLEMVRPTAIVKTPFSGNLIRTENQKKIVTTTTPGHRMVARDKHGRLEIHRADEPPPATRFLPRSGVLSGPGVPLTDDQIRFCIAVSADTSIRNDGDDNQTYYNGRYGVTVFKKTRKIERFRMLASAVGVEVKEKSDLPSKEGYVQFLMHLPDWCPGKVFPSSWLTEMSASQRQLFLSELTFWDGNSVPNRTMTEYATNRRDNADFVQAIAHTAGMCATQVERRNQWGEWIKVTLTYRERASWQALRQSEVPYEGDVWCLSVPSGMMLVRHENCVVITGNCDVCACWAAGWEAVVSAPDGAGTGRGAFAAFDEPRAGEHLGAARRIIIATDGDEPGRAYGDALVERFGPARCWRVEWPADCKDANDVLQRMGADALDRLLERARPVPLPGIRPLSAHRDALHRLYEEGFSPGVSTGWPEFDNLWRPVPGELVVVTGYPGHGKTSWLNHFLVNLAFLNEWRLGLYSPEQGGEGEILGKFVQIVSATPYLPTEKVRINREALDSAIDWVGDHFWEIYSEDADSQGFASLTVPQILARSEPLAMKSMRALVIDPWNECESARPKHMSVEEYISTSLSTIRNWDKRNQVSTIVVAHPRKPDSIKNYEDSSPNGYAISGAAHWLNKADILLTVHRNKETGITTVEVKKHRREGITGELGAVEFQYDRLTGRFHELGTVIPSELGLGSYLDLPGDLVRLDGSEEVADEWVETEFEMA